MGTSQFNKTEVGYTQPLVCMDWITHHVRLSHHLYYYSENINLLNWLKICFKLGQIDVSNLKGNGAV